MAKQQKTLRLSQAAITMVQEVFDSNEYSSWTDALEHMIRNSYAVHSIPDHERDRLRVSCKRGPYAEDYDKHERKMINFFWL